MGNQSVVWTLTWVVLGLTACATAEPKKREYSKTDRARLLVNMANGALIDGDSIGALQNLKLAENYDAKLPELHHSRALAYFMRKDLNSAIDAAKVALSLAPAYSEANNTLGKLFLDSQRYQEAIHPLTLAANDPLYRDSFKAWTNLGIVKFYTGELHLSETYLRRAIQDSPSKACVAHYFRGKIEAQGTRYREAIGDFKEATQRECSKFVDAKFALGEVYQKNRQYDHARKTFLEIQQLYPNTKQAEQAINQLRFLP